MSDSSLVDQEGAMRALQSKPMLKGFNNCVLFNIQKRFEFPNIFLRNFSAELAFKFQVAEPRKCFKIQLQ